MSADIIALPRRTDAPVSVLPRKEFGQRKAGMDAAREADERQRNRIKALAAEARNARNALDGKHVCPSLKADLAARIRGVAQQLEALSAEAKSYGLLSTRIALNEHAGLLEGEAALVEAD